MIYADVTFSRCWLLIACIVQPCLLHVNTSQHFSVRIGKEGLPVGWLWRPHEVLYGGLLHTGGLQELMG